MSRRLQCEKQRQVHNLASGAWRCTISGEIYAVGEGRTENEAVRQAEAIYEYDRASLDGRLPPRAEVVQAMAQAIYINTMYEQNGGVRPAIIQPWDQIHISIRQGFEARAEEALRIVEDRYPEPERAVRGRNAWGNL